MEDKNNGELVLESTGSKPRIQRGDSTENIVSSGNRGLGWSAQRIYFSTMDAINHALIILVTGYVVYLSAKEYSVTNVHVILCTIGYVLFMSEAIFVLADDNILTNSLSRRASKHLHWILQALGLIFSVTGVAIMYNAKSAHFLSIHGITGISSLVIVSTVAIFGYPVWIAWKLRKFVRPLTVKFLHTFLGTIGFVIGIVAQCYGYRKKYIYHLTQVNGISEVLLALTVMIAFLTLRHALVSLFRQAHRLSKSICPSLS